VTPTTETNPSVLNTNARRLTHQSRPTGTAPTPTRSAPDEDASKKLMFPTVTDAAWRRQRSRGARPWEEPGLLETSPLTRRYVPSAGHGQSAADHPVTPRTGAGLDDRDRLRGAC
jgi:hypothetical protein